MSQMPRERIAELTGKLHKLQEKRAGVQAECVRFAEREQSVASDLSAMKDQRKGIADRVDTYQGKGFWWCCKALLIVVGLVLIWGGASIEAIPGQELIQFGVMRTGFGAEPATISILGEPGSFLPAFMEGLLSFVICVLLLPSVRGPFSLVIGCRWFFSFVFALTSFSGMAHPSGAPVMGMSAGDMHILANALSARAAMAIFLTYGVWACLGLRCRALEKRLASTAAQEDLSIRDSLAIALRKAAAERELKSIDKQIEGARDEIARIEGELDKARMVTDFDDRMIRGLSELRAYLDRVDRLHDAGAPIDTVLEPIALIGHAGTGKTWSRFYIARRYYLAGITATSTVRCMKLSLLGDPKTSADKTVEFLASEQVSLLHVDCTEYAMATGGDEKWLASQNRERLENAFGVLRELRTRLPHVLVMVECRPESADEILAGLSDAKGPFVRAKNRLYCEDLSPRDLLFSLEHDSGEGKISLDAGSRDVLLRGFERARRVNGDESVNGNMLGSLVDDLVASCIELGGHKTAQGAYAITEEMVCDALANEEWGQVRVDDAERKQVRDAAMAELNGLIGLGSVKETLANFETTLQFERALAMANGGAVSQGGARKPSFAFLGPAGTGKTTVARLMARLLYGIGICDTDKLVITNPNDLTAGFVRQSGPNTRVKLEEARGGVLFVDEAYNLQTPEHSNASGDFADAVIAELLTAMTSEESNVVLVFAGYEDSMQKFFDSNEGIRSRITNEVHFESYTPEELAQIVEGKLTKMRFEVAPACHDVLVRLMAHIATLGESYANARGAEKVAGEIKDEKARQWQLDQHGVDVREIGPGVIEAVLQAHLDGER